MKIYKYFPEFDDDDCLLWHVYETTTNQIIHSCLFEEDAQEYCRQYERGAGFAGFTPSFMLNKVSVKTDINEAFSAQFA
jgi:hypothetical protein